MLYNSLKENLITKYQVIDNLRRTSSKHLISLLEHNQINTLALKYFGVNANGIFTSKVDEIKGYMCPYTGEISYDNLHLEHILPVSSGGGTILFNCIPVTEKANLSKSDTPNIIEWWLKQPFFDYGRLERLINYIFEAYETYDISDFSGYECTNDGYLVQELVDNTIYTGYDKVDKVGKINKLDINYYQVLKSLIDALSNVKDVSIYVEKLKKLKDSNIFELIEKKESILNFVQEILKKYSYDKDLKYLSYAICIDINRLYHSLKSDDYKTEILQRFDLIIEILNNHNKSIYTYLDSLSDIEEVNLLYFDKVTDDDISKFLSNLTLSVSNKVDIFIDMLSDDSNTRYRKGNPINESIFYFRNTIPFKGYEQLDGVYIRHFYYDHSDLIYSTIINKMSSLEHENSITNDNLRKRKKLKKALEKIRIYEFTRSLNERISVFIHMVSQKKYTSFKNGFPDKNNIISQCNNVLFEGFETLNDYFVGQFYRGNSDAIKMVINENIEKLSKKTIINQEDDEEIQMYKNARHNIELFEFYCSVDMKIDVFIRMLFNSKYLKYTNGKPNINNIFNTKNRIPFEGYEEINGLYVGEFWAKYGERIKSKIISMIEQYESKTFLCSEEQTFVSNLKKALENIKNRDLSASVEQKKELFIQMLFDDKYTSYEKGRTDRNNIFGYNKVKFKGVDDSLNMVTNQFWKRNSNIITETINSRILELELKSNPDLTEIDLLSKYKKAKRAIEVHQFVSDYTLKIEKYIEMMSENYYTSYSNGRPDKNNIFVYENKVPFKDYEEVKGLSTSHFWATHSEKIKDILEKKLSVYTSIKNPSYDDLLQVKKILKCLKAIDDYEFYINLDLRIDKFIEMLTEERYISFVNGKPDSNNILVQSTKIPFKGHEDIQGLYTNLFWITNSEKIKIRLIEMIHSIQSIDSLSEDINNRLNKLLYAKRKIDIYEFYINTGLRCKKFIEMLLFDRYTNYTNTGPDRNNIFNSKNRILYLGYEDLNEVYIKDFWQVNYHNVIKYLFFSKEYEGQEYNIARNKVMTYINNIRRLKRKTEYLSIIDFIREKGERFKGIVDNMIFDDNDKQDETYSVRTRTA